MAEENMNQDLPVEGGQPETPQLSLQDIATVVQIIDICSRRGGFEGAELEAVGGVRSRIVSFLNAASAAQGQEAPEGSVPVEEPSVEEVVED